LVTAWIILHLDVKDKPALILRVVKFGIVKRG
jgi:hypothetical protein